MLTDHNITATYHQLIEDEAYAMRRFLRYARDDLEILGVGTATKHPELAVQLVQACATIALGTNIKLAAQDISAALKDAGAEIASCHVDLAAAIKEAVVELGVISSERAAE